MKHTLGTAAKATGVSKSTIYRAVKSGKVSASRNADDEYEIDPAELHRVYPPVSERAINDDMERSATPEDTGSDTTLAFLREQVLKAQADADEFKQELEDARTELKDTTERLSEHREAARLLIDPKTFEEKEREWKESISARQAEIESARAEAAEISERLKREATERAKAESRARALEGRGLIARLLNRKPEAV